MSFFSVISRTETRYSKIDISHAKRHGDCSMLDAGYVIKNCVQ